MIIVPVIALHDIKKNKIALSLRSEGKLFPGFFEFPGGKVEAGETSTEALLREAFEELDISLEKEHLYPIAFDDFSLKGKPYLLLLYYCDQFEGTLIGKEGQYIEWFPVESLDDCKMIPTNKNILVTLVQYLQRFSEE